MNVNSIRALSLAEVKQYLSNSEEHEQAKVVGEYIKKFCDLKEEKAKELIEELKKLGNVKLREDYVVKIADLLPRDAEALHKIFHDVSLDEGEVNSILEIVKNY